jgi:dinuclear metal center YbgI/SA1388 family protein
MQLTKLASSLDQYLKIDTFEDSSSNGLQVEGARSARKAAFGVSACLELFQRAEAWGAQAVIVHHGLFWKGADTRLIGNLKERVEFLVRRRISLLAYHLPLDAHPELGNNILLARGLGLAAIEPFGIYGKSTIGFKGSWSPAISSFAAKSRVEKLTRHQAVWIKGDSRKLTNVGVVSGGAAHEFFQAPSAGLDLYVTGEPAESCYHFARETGIHFMSAGHHATERFGIRALASYVNKMGVQTRFIDVPNPL